MNDVFRWNDWNEDHIGKHGVLPEKAEYLVNNAKPPNPKTSAEGNGWFVANRPMADSSRLCS
jgi:hypothetical protein